jgi:hypothetical protein
MLAPINQLPRDAQICRLFYIVANGVPKYKLIYTINGATPDELIFLIKGQEPAIR